MNIIDIPSDEVLRMSNEGHAINDYFVKQGHEEWQLGRIASRKLVWRLEDELRAAKEKIAQLERGEFICQKCGLRKDDEFEKGDF